MSSFNINDILKFAINIEEIGEKFYNDLSKQNKNTSLKELFDTLAIEEKNHYNYFKSILDSIDINDGDFNEDYFLYIKAFIDNAVFKQNDKTNFNSIIDVVDFAMSKEIESINYYNEIKAFLNEKDKIEIIINEEKKHFRKLFELKMTLK